MQKRKLGSDFQMPLTNVSRVGRNVYFAGEVNEDSVLELMKLFEEIQNEDEEIGVQTNAEDALNGLIDLLGKNKEKLTKEELRSVRNIINDFRNSNENLSPEDREPIHFYINSVGGDAFDCFGMVDFIRNTKTPIWGYTYKAFSSAFIIFEVCDRRFMYPNGTLIYHQLQTGSMGAVQDVFEDVNEGLKIQERVEKLTLECTNITPEKLREIRERKIDWHIDAKTALELGIADEII